MLLLSKIYLNIWPVRGNYINMGNHRLCWRICCIIIGFGLRLRRCSRLCKNSGSRLLRKQRRLQLSLTNMSKNDQMIVQTKLTLTHLQYTNQMQTKQHHQPPPIKQDNTHYNHLTQLSTKFNEKYQQSHKYLTAMKKSKIHIIQLQPKITSASSQQQQQQLTKLIKKISAHIDKLMTVYIGSFGEIEDLYGKMWKQMGQVYEKIEEEKDCQVWRLVECGEIVDKCKIMWRELTNFDVQNQEN